MCLLGHLHILFRVCSACICKRQVLDDTVCIYYNETYVILILGGDAGTHNYDAEIDGRAGSLLYYGNDHCNRTDPFTFPGALASNVYKMSMFVGNEYFRVINDRGFDQDLCSDCGFALNGQYDITLNQNEIYIALNRVVTGQDDRDGYGLCYLRATWACPYHYQCPWLPC